MNDALHPDSSPPGPVQIEDVVGSPTESPIYIDKKPCLVLLDTGATISTISQTACSALLGRKPKPLDEFKLDVTGAGDHNIPYTGYVEADISLPQQGLPSLAGILLVVPYYFVLPVFQQLCYQKIYKIYMDYVDLIMLT